MVPVRKLSCKSKGVEHQNKTMRMEDSPIYFRSLLTAGKCYKREQEAKIYLVKGIYGYLSEYFKFKEFQLPKIENDMSIEDVANALRDEQGLGRRPIENLVYVA